MIAQQRTPSIIDNTLYPTALRICCALRTALLYAYPLYVEDA